jgi:hypothetical protein
VSEAGPLVSFSFRSCAGAFLEIPTDSARDILPADLQPVELHHGAAVLSVMAFDYRDTPFGDYRELVLGIAVAPRVDVGAAMPRSAFFPFALVSTSSGARQFGAEQLHLPYAQEEMELRMQPSDGGVKVVLMDGATPVIEMLATEHEWHPVVHAYQAFMHNASGVYAADIRMSAQFSENEDERGHVTLHPHALTARLPLADIEATPFREQLMRDGVQLFQQIRRVGDPARQ